MRMLSVSEPSVHASACSAHLLSRGARRVVDVGLISMEGSRGLGPPSCSVWSSWWLSANRLNSEKRASPNPLRGCSMPAQPIVVNASFRSEFPRFQ